MEDLEDPAPSIPLALMVAFAQSLAAGWALKHHIYIFAACMLIGAGMWALALLDYLFSERGRGPKYGSRP